MQSNVSWQTKSDILNAINKRTKAIIVVDLDGMPYDLLDLRTSVPDNIIIINDAAQAHGSKYQQHSVGCHADMTCWSFYPGKTLGAIGDAGVFLLIIPIMLKSYALSQITDLQQSIVMMLKV